MAEVVVKVVADSKQATKNVDDLNDALEDTGKAAEKASEEINVAEGRIKALGGAINIVGGSVEVLAGGLALSGALTEEQAERFEAAAVGALVFADGTKRVFEGVKELKEGIQLLGGAQKIATVATKAFGIATKIALGPIGIAIAAIGLITTAIILLKDKFEAVNKVATFFGNIFKSIGNALGFAKTEAEKFQEAQAELSKETEFQLKLLQAQGASTDELIKKERELLTQRKNSFKEGTEERIEAEQELALFEAKVLADRQAAITAADEERAKKIKENAEKRKQAVLAAQEIVNEAELALLDDQARELAEAEQQYIEDRAALKAAGFTDFTAVEEAYNQQVAEINDNYRQQELDAQDALNAELIAKVQQRIDLINRIDDALVITDEDRKAKAIQDTTIYYNQLIEEARANGIATVELEKAKQDALTKLNQEGIDERSAQIKFFESDTAAAISATLSTASNLLGALRENVDEDTREGFELSKKYKIAEVVTSTIQAAFDAYKSLIGIPVVGPILAPAASAAAVLAGRKAISDIQSTSFDSTSVPGGGSISGGGAPTTFNVPSNQNTGFDPNPQTAVPETVSPEPVRAYVLVNDVNSAQAANASINRRRTFGPG